VDHAHRHELARNRLPLPREIVRPIYVERGILAAAQLDGAAKAL